MKRSTKDDRYDWFGALDRSTEQARGLQDRTSHPVIACHCGAIEDQGRDIGAVVDLTAEDVTVVRNEGIRRCRVCPHAIHHGAMSVQLHYEASTTVRDHFHPNCVRL